MALLLEAMQVGSQIAAQRNQRLAQEEARKQRQAEALALQQYRQEQIFNQIRDDERSMKEAEALADWRKAESQRHGQEAVDRASDRAVMDEDRDLVRDDRRAVVNEKIRTEALAEKFARGVGSRMYQPTEADQDWAGIGGFEIPAGQSATDAMAAEMANTGYAPPSVLTELARGDRPGAEVSHEPKIYEKDGYKFYQGRYGPVLIPGQNEDKRNMHQERVKEPGSNTTTTRWVPNPKPEPPATDEQQAEVREMIRKRREAEAEKMAVSQPAPMNRQRNVAPPPKPQEAPANQNRMRNVGKPQALKPNSDTERSRVVDKNGKPFTVFKSKLAAFLKANPDFKLDE